MSDEQIWGADIRPRAEVDQPETSSDVRVEEEKPWLGVYPGYCRNPETCRGYGHCPRDYSCVE